MFWNVNKSDSPGLVAEAARSEDIDVLILAESRIPLAKLAVALNRGQQRTYITTTAGMPARLRRSVSIFFRLPDSAIRPLLDSAGLFAVELSPPLGPSITVVGLHLRSKLFASNEHQSMAAVEMRNRIDAIEQAAGHRRTVVIGDFNMQPFETGLIAANAFNAVMSRKIASNGSRQVDGVDRHYFYNPMWNHFGDRPPSPPGSYYLAASGFMGYHWHMLDQVILRPELLPYFADEDVRLLSKIGEVSLLAASGEPDAQYSDHLPLVVTIEIEKGVFENGQDQSVGEDQGIDEGPRATPNGVA